ncbi:leucine-rich melanocyte differentiation-associated protein-like [Gigantopelta aegis]|uniref:leucine-rich melanocyte differentiation-associated protein-like n=1 Tax=Gigantopelta aegis TaxID=1735272 RepID=UPI001B88C86B|nr:leucine-rich melanocyte differentiation-associated protein-like [Gigantopelta aegis]
MAEMAEDGGRGSESPKRRCTLAYLDLAEVPRDLAEKYGSLIEELDLSNNKVSDLRFLYDFPKLCTLILDHNLIHSQVKLPPMPQLHTLWLNHNKIKISVSMFISTIAKTCPNLRFLSMMNNEAAPSYFNGGSYQQYVDFRYFVISKLAYLQVLDDKPVSPEERSEAERIYRMPVRRTKKVSSGNKKKRKEER